MAMKGVNFHRHFFYYLTNFVVKILRGNLSDIFKIVNAYFLVLPNNFIISRYSFLEICKIFHCRNRNLAQRFMRKKALMR